MGAVTIVNCINVIFTLMDDSEHFIFRNLSTCFWMIALCGEDIICLAAPIKEMGVVEGQAFHLLCLLIVCLGAYVSDGPVWPLRQQTIA